MIINTEKNEYLGSKNCQDKDTITILDAGKREESKKYTYDDGNPKINFNFKVKHNGQEKVMSFNKYSLDNLALAYGEDTEKWIGKEATVKIELCRSLNTNMIILETTDIKAKEVWEGE